MAFTAHNSRFNDGTVTMSEAPHLLADAPWCQGAKQVLASRYRGSDRGGRIADFARNGFDVLGI